MSTILIIDDEPDNFDVIETFLSDQEYDLHYAANGQDGIDILETIKPDLILLDVMMPRVDGIEVCRRIKAVPKWENLPIIIVTSLTGKKDLAECLNAGADDFITKPVNRLELRARVRSMLRIRHQYQELATFNTRLESIVVERTAQLHLMIFEDWLTNLPSRAFLLEKMTDMLQSGNASFAIIYLDCDQFKLVNSSLGHEIGNDLLRAIAQRLKKYQRPDDILARFGEDEFCFLVQGINDLLGLIALIEQILEGFHLPFIAGNNEIFMTACAGVALAKDNLQQPQEILQAADTAMYQAKLDGKGCYRVFDQAMKLAITNRLTLQNDLQRALEQKEFITYYQPIINLKTGTLAGFEALARWNHARRGWVSPGEFIPCLEDTGLIVPVGIMILRQACQELSRLQQQGLRDITMSVNLSVRQFASVNLLRDIDQVLAETGINPAYLKLEITESAIMDHAEIAINMTKELRSRQIQISIDDFGTGYSSLGYLHRLPMDNLKIDRSFVNQLDLSNNEYHVVNTIIHLSKQLGLSVTAEGIETQEQLECLRQLDCEFGQGYLFAKPLSAAEVKRKYLLT
ncbi:MAG: EAL domain-containing protein [Pseudanabaena sp. ELA607]